MFKKILPLLFFCLPLLLQAESSSPQKTVCLSMIVKNEAPIIKRCLSSVKDYIDTWVIVDTGSTDGTQEIVKECLKGIPGNLYERPWVHFEHNRNEAFSLAQEKADYILLVNADEELRFPSSFSKDLLDKDCYVSLLQTKKGKSQKKFLVKSSLNWRWEGILHSELLCGDTFQAVFVSDVVVVGSEDGSRSKDPKTAPNDRVALEKAVEIRPNDIRSLFYLAENYLTALDYPRALKQFETISRLKAPDAVLYGAFYQTALIGEILGLPSEKILANYNKAFACRPSRAEPLFRMAHYYLMQGNPLIAYACAKSALPLSNPHDAIYNEDKVYDYGIHLVLAHAASQLHKEKEAIQAFETILASSAVPPEVRQEAETALLTLKKEQKTK